MSTGTVFTITSLKGGVGKSTIAANLANAFARKGKRTLAIDCDFNMRCLDLILGLENQVVYDIYDVLYRGVPLSRAVIADERRDNLFFCAAPYSTDSEVSDEDFASLVRRCVNEEKYDIVIIDTPGDTKRTLSRVAKVTDTAVVVTTHQPAAVRAAERTGYYFGEFGVTSRKLLINSFDSGSVLHGVHPGIISTIDRTGMQLLGVIPYEPQMNSLQETGKLVADSGGGDTATAFDNIADRLIGENVPLFRSFRHVDKNITTV